MATQERLSLISETKCNESLLTLLSDLLLKINPYAHAYRMMHEVEKKAVSQGCNASSIQMVLKQDRQSDPRRYNNPTSNEVAIVFQNVDGLPPFDRDLVIFLRHDENSDQPEIRNVNVLDCNLDPMSYPVLFPRGERGWNQFISQSVGNRRVSMRQYFAYRLSIRYNFNPILNAGKLTQQFIVDAYVKIEANNLNFIRYQQNQLRVELYQGLMDHMHVENDERSPQGRLVILPSSFPGSPRNMQQRYRDAMAIVQKYGKPDIFLTMTCNPKWREITENKNEWNQTEHRPDLVARVFHIKLKSLLDDLLKHHVLGVVFAKIYVIEFQKRGLPHAHILLILEESAKPTTPEKIDAIVCAEIPDPTYFPRLFQVVISNMIHTPCGEGSNMPCMDNGKCKKRFPKEYQQHTVVNIGGYPQYRRRHGTSYFHRGKSVNNLWVVPFNPKLSLKYNCHINVEICASFQSVKYLFKYVYKGHDCANILISERNDENHDEVQTYLDTRYVSAPEACWRIFAFNMHEQSHTVVRLAVHLPNMQTVYFTPDNITQAINRAERRNTTLTAWFQLNINVEGARQLFYHQVPEYYRFVNFTWQARVYSSDKVIGRMYAVSPLDSERYFLRVLLLHIRGAQSFEQLRTVNGVTFPTFKEAARELGLLEKDDIWEQTLNDAALTNNSRSLRQLFAIILVFNLPSNPLHLWDQFREQLVEDFCYRFGHNYGDCTVCEDCALCDLNETLSCHGKNCTDFGLRSPRIVAPAHETSNVLHNAMLEAAELKSSLTIEQQQAFDIIMGAVMSSHTEPKLFFLDGPGGSGKTYLYQVLISELRSMSIGVVITASTGIASNLLQGGRTVHSQFKISIPVNETTVSNVKLNSNDADILKCAKLFIIDEATMILNHVLNIVDLLLREIMGNDIPFGSKTVLLGGDFRQCLPVVPHGQPAAIVQSSIKFSTNWSKFKFLSLTKNIRSIDPLYSDWLLKLGDGDLGNNSELSSDIIEIPDSYISASVINDIYGSRLDHLQFDSFSKKSILCPRNEDVDKINEEVLKILDGQLKTYFSFDKIECDDKNDEQNFPTEFVHGLTPSNMPPHILNLKIGAIVMLLRNLNTKRGLCNGTKLCITTLHDNVLEVKVLTGSAEGCHVFIPRISLSPSSQDLPFKLIRRQFPIKMAFAMSINKAQGQTLDKVGIFLKEPVFSHGQLYVAFSRVRSSSDVKIQIYDTQEQGKLNENLETVFTKNVVYRDIFNI